MLKYLNTNIGYENYQKLLNTKFFVDKTDIIDKLNKHINTTNGYICITRPRRFGKSSVADMLAAYYTKNIDSSNLFNDLNISKSESYRKNLNSHNTIKIDFSKLPDEILTYEDYIGSIKSILEYEIKKSYPHIEEHRYDNTSDLLHKSGDKFIFIFDEWDFIFNKELFIDNQNDFLEFLRGLLKDNPYVSLCYMTGILPIKKHSSNSALNMFDEFTFLNDGIYDDYFGFSENEVKQIVQKQSKLTYKDLEKWYNGYFTEDGNRIYNPRSVVKALETGKLRSYWTNTGKMDEVLQYLKYNTLEVRDDVVKLVNNQVVRVNIREEYRAGQRTPKTRLEIYSAMIVLGFLSYHEGLIKIPNQELMYEYEKALEDESFGQVSEIIRRSEKMLEATLDKDKDTLVEILHDIHNMEIPVLKYNDENSLSCVVTLAYLSARDSYRIEREEKNGKGYTDFTFYPRYSYESPFILELKKDDTTDNAIAQIKEKEYYKKFKQEYKDREILIVAICYNSKTKEHSVDIETI